MGPLLCWSPPPAIESRRLRSWSQWPLFHASCAAVHSGRQQSESWEEVCRVEIYTSAFLVGMEGRHSQDILPDGALATDSTE